VKALDTGVLLALLEGSSRARDLMRKLRGTELATTEANLLELGYLAGRATHRETALRLAAIERLRQRLTVLPLGERGVHEATVRLARSGGRLAPSVVAMLGTLESAGCDELLTDDPRSLVGEWRFKVRAVTV
jgi:predicted nucleic acid-binding protein